MSTNLPEGFTARAPQPAEIRQVYEFIKMCDIAEVGQPDIDLDELEIKWSQPDFNLETDALLVLTPQGEIVGYGSCQELGKPTMLIAANTHPGFYDKGIGSFLLDRAEERLGQQIGRLDPTLEVTFANWSHSPNQAARRLLESRGYRQIREFWQMEYQFEGPPLAPAWPDGIAVRSFVRGQDEQAVYDVYEATFSDHWGHVPISFAEYAEKRFTRKDFNPDMWFLAVNTASGEAAGYAACSLDPEDDRGWVNNLGVKRAYRRGGLGLALLRHSFQKIYEKGKAATRLVVDGQSLTGAVSLYTGAGMQPVMSYTRFEKIVRPGIAVGVKELAG